MDPNKPSKLKPSAPSPDAKSFFGAASTHGTETQRVFDDMFEELLEEMPAPTPRKKGTATKSGTTTKGLIAIGAIAISDDEQAAPPKKPDGPDGSPSSSKKEDEGDEEGSEDDTFQLNDDDSFVTAEARRNAAKVTAAHLDQAPDQEG